MYSTALGGAQSVMRYTSNKSFIFSGIALLLLVVTIAVSTVRTVYADTAEPESGERILFVHDGSVERGILTKATTVREALEEAHIPFDTNDLVEPGLDEKLIATSYDVNIYRARPITVVDGAIRKKIMSAFRTPAQIAEHAGVTLRAEDLADMEMTTGVGLDGASIQLTIKRAIPIRFVLYGNQATVYTQAKTVADLLDEKEITLSEKDKLSVAVDQVVIPNMKIELWREGKQTVTREEKVKFATDKIYDTDRPVGYRQIRTPGTNGKRSVTYEINIRNGKEVSRKEIQSVVLVKPKKQVEIVGSKPEFVPYTGGGNKDTWLAASNIPRSQWGLAEWLVQKESGWNPNARNVSSGACGLGQQLPCGKWAGAWNDPVASLNGMHGYVMGRYGSWDAAVAHSRSVGWY